MKALGFALLAAGFVLIALAMLMSVGMENPAAMIDGIPDAPIANMDLMNQRLLFGVVGAGLFVSGWLALILDRLPAAKPSPAPASSFDGQY